MKNLLILIIIFLGLSCALTARAGIIIKPVFNTGLVGYWDFQEGAGSNVYDKSGQRNDGTWNGTAGLVNENFEANPGYDTAGWTEVRTGSDVIDEDNTEVTPPIGGGSQILKIVTDGTNDCQTYINSGALHPISYSQFYIRVLTDSLANNESLGWAWGWNSAGYGSADSWRFVLRRDGSGNYFSQIYFRGGATAWWTPDVYFIPGTWYKLEVKYDVTNNIAEFRIDGVNKATDTLGAGKTNGVQYLGLGSTWGSAIAASSYFDLLKISATGWDQGYWANGKIGETGSFNGTDDYVEIADDSDLSFGNSSTDTPMTVSAWIKMNDATEFKIITKGEYPNIEYYFRLGDVGSYTDNLIVRVYDSSTGAALGRMYNTALTAYENQWIHVAFTYDGSATTAGIKLYLNGVRVDDTDYNYSSGYVAMENLSAPVWIGRYTTYYSNGLIDEMRVYNRALSAGEIKRLYKLSQPKILAAPRNGLVGYWSFNEGTGSKVGDMSGNGSTGTWNGAGSHWADGKFGKAGSFNGSGDYVDAGNPASLQLGNTGAISLWLKFSYIISSPAGAVISKDEGVNDRNGYMIWITTSTGRISAEIADDDGADVIEPQQPLNDNKWHHVVFTWDGSFLHFYIDNVSAATPYPQSLTPITNVYNLHIGKIASVDNYYFNGLIDEVRIYNRDLDQSEITALYNSSLQKINASQNNQLTTGLVGLWSFNGPDIDGSEAIDRSGNGNNGTITGATKTIGKIGQALSFNGSSNYIDLGYPSFYLIGPPVTYSAWVKPASLNSGAVMNVGTYNANARTVIAILSGYLYAGGVNHQDIVDLSAAGNPISTNGWNHILYVIDADNSAGIYINGIKYAATGTDYIGSTASFYIGAKTSTENYFNGSIDEVRIYNRVLTAQEILRLYNLGH